MKKKEWRRGGVEIISPSVGSTALMTHNDVCIFTLDLTKESKERKKERKKSLGQTVDHHLVYALTSHESWKRFLAPQPWKCDYSTHDLQLDWYI